MVDLRERLEMQIAQGKDSALVRFGLGKLYLEAGEAEIATLHLSQAVALDPKYAAAWAQLGRAETARGNLTAAGDAFRSGIKVAEGAGEIQAARQMKVLLKRLQ